ncbi:MAG: hypothetical protein ACKO0Z_08020 [Betaproteobacteria bacterium]
MTAYKVTLKPGGIARRDVDLGIKLQKQPTDSASSGGAGSGSSTPSLEVRIIHPVSMTGASVSIAGPNGFTDTITETTIYDPASVGEYSFTAAAVAGHSVGIFDTPSVVLEGEKTCVFIIYAVAGGGGGGDCTPTCPINPIKFIPIGTSPSIPILDFTDITKIPDVEFSENYDPGHQIYGNSYQIYGRFFGEICCDQTVYFYVSSSRGGSFPTAVDCESLVVGNTFVVNLSITVYAVLPPGENVVGQVSISYRVYDPGINEGDLTLFCNGTQSFDLNIIVSEGD